MNQCEAKAKADHKKVKKDQAKAREEHKKVKKDLQRVKRLQDQLRIDQANTSAVSQQERQDMRKSFREQLQSIGEELTAQFQAAQKTKGEIDVTSVIKSILQERAKKGRIPLPNSDEMESEYELPEPPCSKHSGRGSIQ
jgi:aspartokinase